MGQILYRSMKSGGHAVYQEMMTVGDDGGARARRHKGVKPPVPDARFFNAALDLFGRKPEMVERAGGTKPRYWKRRLLQAKERFARRGLISRNWSPELQEVVSGMVSAGFSVPLGFREIFVGCGVSGLVRGHPKMRPFGRRSEMLPREKIPFRPHALPVARTRGLPLRRTRRRRKVE